MRGAQLTGKVFGRLTVLGLSHRDNGKHWHCLCECGNRCISSTSHLNAGKNRISCGCLNKEIASELGRREGPKRAIHGLNGTPLKGCYSNMIKRCYDPKDKRYQRYGGRGIAVCDEWRNSRHAFYGWALSSGYAKGLTIERINVDGNYSPENCTWISMASQQANTSRSILVEWGGEVLHLAELCRREGVNYMMVYKRLRRGWGIQRAVGLPSGVKND